jgi:hypothetical protein
MPLPAGLLLHRLMRLDEIPAAMRDEVLADFARPV